MKKILKIILKKFAKCFIAILNTNKIGRYFNEYLSKYIFDQKKVVKHNSVKLVFYSPNRINRFRIETFSSKEPETLRWIENFEENSVLWDIGANIGLYSSYAAKKNLCKVYAFEPSIFNLEWLGRNIFLNNLVEKIVVIPIPLTDIISQNTLNFSSTEWSGALTTFGQSYGHDGKDLKKVFEFSTVSMSMNDLKNLLKISQPDYIKIDVDGIEHLILQGGEKVLLNTKELLIEVNERFEQQKNQCFKYLKELGFTLKEKRRSDLFKDTDFSLTYNQIWVK